MSTIYQIAAKSRVTSTTFFHVINNRRFMCEATRQRGPDAKVETAALEQGCSLVLCTSGVGAQVEGHYAAIPATGQATRRSRGGAA